MEVIMGREELEKQAMQTWRKLESAVRDKQNSKNGFLQADKFLEELKYADEKVILQIIKRLEQDIDRLYN